MPLNPSEWSFIYIEGRTPTSLRVHGDDSLTSLLKGLPKNLFSVELSNVVASGAVHRVTRFVVQLQRELMVFLAVCKETGRRRVIIASKYQLSRMEIGWRLQDIKGTNDYFARLKHLGYEYNDDEREMLNIRKQIAELQAKLDAIHVRISSV